MVDPQCPSHNLKSVVRAASADGSCSRSSGWSWAGSSPVLRRATAQLPKHLHHMIHHAGPVGYKGARAEFSCSSCGVAATFPCCSWPCSPHGRSECQAASRRSTGVSAPSCPRRRRAAGRWVGGPDNFSLGARWRSSLSVSLFSSVHSSPSLPLRDAFNQFCFRIEDPLLWTNTIPKTLSDLFFVAPSCSVQTLTLFFQARGCVRRVSRSYMYIHLNSASAPSSTPCRPR
jgi:hypothetical protein